MRAQCVTGHQLIGGLFRERGFKPSSDIDGRELPVLTRIVCFWFRSLQI
jgi:hypothetical protein